MSKIVNLNRFRKQKARGDKAKHAEEKRARFGRSKAEKTKTKAEEAKRQAHIDGHQLEDRDE